MGAGLCGFRPLAFLTFRHKVGGRCCRMVPRVYLGPATNNNTTMDQQQLNEVLHLHKMWLRGEEGGVRANLRGADLSGANLSGAYLTGADLSGAVHAWSQVAFIGHGERGRMLTAVVFKEGEEAVYQCGCFSGSADELRQYIEQGEERYKASRTRAFEVATELLNIPKA